LNCILVEYLKSTVSEEKTMSIVMGLLLMVTAFWHYRKYKDKWSTEELVVHVAFLVGVGAFLLGAGIMRLIYR